MMSSAWSSDTKAGVTQWNKLLKSGKKVVLHSFEAGTRTVARLRIFYNLWGFLIIIYIYIYHRIIQWLGLKGIYIYIF